MPLNPVQLTPELMQYCINASVPEQSVLAELRNKTAELPLGLMQIDAVQGQFLYFMATLIGAQKTLDIGVFTGYSSLVVALALSQEGRVYACDTSEEWTNIARQYWQKAGVADKIHLTLAPAQDTLQQYIDAGGAGSFDMAFIDADKTNYDFYYEQCLILCRPGGVIILDNMLDEGKVADISIQTARVNRFRALNTKVRDDARVTASLLPVADGMLLAIKR